MKWTNTHVHHWRWSTDQDPVAITGRRQMLADHILGHIANTALPVLFAVWLVEHVVHLQHMHTSPRDHLDPGSTRADTVVARPVVVSAQLLAAKRATLKFSCSFSILSSSSFRMMSSSLWFANTRDTYAGCEASHRIAIRCTSSSIRHRAEASDYGNGGACLCLVIFVSQYSGGHLHHGRQPTAASNHACSQTPARHQLLRVS